jgi:hypothetical protein
MKKILLWAPVLVLAGTVGTSFAGEGKNQNAMIPDAKSNLLMQSTPQAVDYGPAATNEHGALLLGQIEAKWGNVMRLMKRWDASSFQQFQVGYRNYPVSILEQALAADTFDGMQSALDSYAPVKAQQTMAKAFPMGKIQPGDASNPLVVEAHQLVGKALGDNANDLVFVPIAPCTVWDTRFASGAPYVGAIGPGVTRQFWSHWNGSGGDFSSYGGNPACTEANQTMLNGGRPFAAMMIVYINNPAGNGWLTFYRDGDPDPSNATISVYYSTGPTRTQTVISKSSRGYGTGTYDIAVTGRFSTADASASVVGYFIKPQVTALECVQVDGAVVAIGAGVRSTGSTPACAAGSTAVSGGIQTGINDNQVLNALGPLGTSFFWSMTNNTAASKNYTPSTTCCRVPGR